MLAMEPLEQRSLLSNLPTLSTNPALNTIVQPGETGTTNQVNPSVAIDPSNPQKMVAVWTRDASGVLSGVNGSAITAFTEGAYTTNGGLTWSPLNGTFTNNVPDFSASPPTASLPTVTDASVAFDANENFYVVDECTTAGTRSASSPRSGSRSRARLPPRRCRITSSAAGPRCTTRSSSRSSRPTAT